MSCRRAWPIACAFCWLGAIGSACGVARRASVNAVDPKLRASGQKLDRMQARGNLRMGGYAIEDIAVEQTQVDPQGPLAREDIGRPIVQHHLAMRLAVPSGAAWTVECTQQRRQSTSAEYAAAIDENRDDIAVQCELRGPSDSAWRFTTEAGVAHNFRGRLMSRHDESALDVEVLVYVQRWGWLRRHLPDPVAQVRRENQAVAAMLLGRPELAWVGSELAPALAEPSVATMLALHHLPLGLDE
jgi:hypothetical protein